MTREGGGMPPAQASLSLPTKPTIPDERVQRILRLIHSGETFDVGDLAIKFNISPSYLQRLFRQQTGVSMCELLSEQRLQRAAKLLKNSNMSVKEVGYTVGFEHVSSFIRAFERRFGRAPARYRKESDDAKC